MEVLEGLEVHFWQCRFMLFSEPTSHPASAKRYRDAQHQEREEFARFKEIMEPTKSFFASLCGVDFGIEYRTAFDFARMIQRDDAEWAGVGRYF